MLLLTTLCTTSTYTILSLLCCHGEVSLGKQDPTVTFLKFVWLYIPVYNLLYSRSCRSDVMHCVEDRQCRLHPLLPGSRQAGSAVTYHVVYYKYNCHFFVATAKYPRPYSNTSKVSPYNYAATYLFITSCILMLI